MNKMMAISAAVLATACMSNSAPREISDREYRELENTLAGRVEEPPVRCVSTRRLGGNRSIGEGMILFKGQTSSMVYVNRPYSGCPVIRDGNAIRVRTITTQLCEGDIIQVYDPQTNVGYGGCALGPFTPYRRVRQRL